MSFANLSALVEPLRALVTIGGAVFSHTPQQTGAYTEFVPDGLANLVQIALSNYSPPGTLLGFIGNNVKHYPPSSFFNPGAQGRARNNDNQSHEDLSTLDDSLKKMMHRVCSVGNTPQEIADLRVIGLLAIDAFVKLDQAYEAKYKENYPKIYTSIQTHIEKCKKIIETHLVPAIPEPSKANDNSATSSTTSTSARSNASTTTETPAPASTVTYSNSPLDKAVWEHHHKAGSVRYIAEQFATINKKTTPKDLKDQCLISLAQWADTNILQFKQIEKAIKKPI